MRTSENKKLGKNKFYNYIKGKQENKFFFFLPTVMKSSKHYLSWDTLMFSLFFAWGRSFIQFNICEVVQNTNTNVYKETMVSLIQCLKESNLEIKETAKAVNFLEKNSHIVLVLKNGNTEHHYIKNLIVNALANQPFIQTKQK